MKQTEKLRKAEQIYSQLGLKEKYSNQEQLYNLLIANNHFWNSQEKRWFNGGEAEPPSKLIKIRVTTAEYKIELVVEALIKVLEQSNLRLVEQSLPYPCRPPKQNDSRVYLTCENTGELRGNPKSYDVVLGGK